MTDRTDYHDIGQTANLWHEIWNSDKHDAVYGIYKTQAFEAMDRATFSRSLNNIMQSFFSHFHLSEAKEHLRVTLLRNQDALGFAFQELAPPSAYQSCEVVYVAPGSPADRQGIQVGDRFYLPNLNSPTLIRESNDSIAVIKNIWDITFFRGPLTIPFKHAIISINSYHSLAEDYAPNKKYEQSLRSMGPGEIAPIVIRSFLDLGTQGEDRNYYEGDTITGALEYAHTHQFHGIVIDLRDNSGGHLHNATHLLSYLLESGTPFSIAVDRQAWNAFRQTEEYHKILEQRHEKIEVRNEKLRKGLINYIQRSRPELVDSIPRYFRHHPLFTGKVAILINKNTASAAEIVAGALRAKLGKERCLLIGEKSSGALLSVAFNPNMVVKGFAINYPCRDPLLPDGTHIEGVGLEPDVRVGNVRNTEECLRIVKRWFAQPSAPQPVASAAPPLPQPPLALPIAAPAESEQVLGIFEDTYVLLDPQWALTTQEIRGPENPFLHVGQQEIPAIEVKSYPGANLKLLYLAWPIINVPLVKHNPAFSKDRPTLEREGYHFREIGDIVLCSKKPGEFFLYGIKNWDPINPGSTSLPLDVRNWINNQIIAAALK